MKYDDNLEQTWQCTLRKTFQNPIFNFFLILSLTQSNSLLGFYGKKNMFSIYFFNQNINIFYIKMT